MDHRPLLRSRRNLRAAVASAACAIAGGVEEARHVDPDQIRGSWVCLLVQFVDRARRTSCAPFCSDAPTPATACRRMRRTIPTIRNDPFLWLARFAPGYIMSFRKETRRILIVRSKWT